MVFDKNERRLRALVREGARPERIARLKAAGPEWWVRYWDSCGASHDEKCPEEYQSERGAAKYEALKRAEVENGTYNAPERRKVKLSVVLDAYCEEKGKHKRSARDIRYNCDRLKRFIGNWYLHKIDQNPAPLVDFFYDYPEPVAPKTVWNIFITLRAAINHWIRFRRLIMKNPCDLIQLDPQVQVIDYVPTREDFEKIIATSYVVGLQNEIRHIFTAVYETGLRINEILRWKVEDMIIDPEDGLPYYFTWISKQRRKMRKAIPMSRPLRDALRDQIGTKTQGPVWSYQTPPYRLIRWVRCESCRKVVIYPDGEHRVGHPCTDCGGGRYESWGLVKEAGVELPRPFHDFRKTAKMRFRAFGKEISKAMQGHATDSMDDYYAHYSRLDLEKAVADSYRDQKGTKKGNGDSDLA